MGKKNYEPDGLESEYGEVPQNNPFSKSFLVINFIKKYQGNMAGFTYDDILDYFSENDVKKDRRKAERLVFALKNNLRDEFEESSNNRNGRKKVWVIKGNSKTTKCSLDDLNILSISLKAVKTTGLNSRYNKLCKIVQKVWKTLETEENKKSEKFANGFDFFQFPYKKEEIDEQVQANLQTSLIEGKRVKIRYKKMEQVIEDAEIYPHGFVYSDGSLYLVSARHQGQRRDNSNILVKYIKMANIINVEFIGAETFIPEDNFTIHEIAEKSLGISNEKSTLFKLHFNQNVAQTASCYQFNDNQKVIQNDDGSCDVEFEGVGVLELSWYLCRFGKSVQVMEPANFKELAERAQQEFENNGCQKVTTSWVKEIV